MDLLFELGRKNCFGVPKKVSPSIAFPLEAVCSPMFLVLLIAIWGSLNMNSVAPESNMTLTGLNFRLLDLVGQAIGFSSWLTWPSFLFQMTVKTFASALKFSLPGGCEATTSFACVCVCLESSPEHSGPVP